MGAPVGRSSAKAIAVKKCGDFLHRFVIDIDRVAQRAQIGDHPGDRRVAGAVRRAAAGALHGGHAQIGGFQAGGFGQADGAVVVQFQRLAADFGQDRRDQRARALGA